MTCAVSRSALAAVLLTVVLLAACAGGAPVDRAAADFKAGKYRSAEVTLKSTLQKNPGNGKAWLLLGRVSLATDQFADAAEQFTRAQKRGVDTAQMAVPMARALINTGQSKRALEVLAAKKDAQGEKLAHVLSLKGRAHLALKQTQAAAAAFKQALQAQPDYALALVGQVNVAEAAGNNAKAIKRLQHAVSVHPHDAHVLEAIGLLAYNHGQCKKAIPRFKQLLSLDADTLPGPRRFVARAYLADCQLRSNQYKAAEQNTAVLIKQAPGNMYANYLQSQIDIKNKDYEQATIHLQRLLKLSPNNPAALTRLGAVKIAQKNQKLAEVYLKKALDQAPGRVPTLRVLAALYMYEKEPQKAIGLLKRALDGHPKNAQIRSMLAEASARAGDLDAALGYMKKGDDRDSGGNRSDAQVDLARTIAGSGDTKAALALLDRIDGLDQSSNFKAIVLKIRIYLQQGHKIKAVKLAQALAKAKPNDAQSLRLLGSTYLAAGHAKPAEAALERALEIAPDNAEVRLDLGLLALRRGDLKKARSQLQQLVQKKPGDLRAYIALGKTELRQGKSAAAIQHFKRAHSIDSSNAFAAIQLINAYMAASQAKKALPVANKLAAAHRDNAAIRRLHGITLLAAGHSRPAVQQLSRAADMADDKPAYRLDLARALMKLGRPRLAMKQLRRLRSDFPDFLPAVPLLAVAQMRAGNFDSAMATANSLEKVAGADGAAQALRGDLLSARRKYAAAAKAYAAAYSKKPSREAALRLFRMRARAGMPDAPNSLTDWLKAHPSDRGVKLVLADWYMGNDKLGAAADLYRGLLRSSNGDSGRAGDAAVLNNLALVYARQGDKRALPTAKKAHAANATNPAITDTLGWLLLQNGRTERGAKLVRKAARAAPGQADIQYHLAVVLSRSEQSQDRARARRILQKLLKSKKGFDDREQARTLLKTLNNRADAA